MGWMEEYEAKEKAKEGSPKFSGQLAGKAFLFSGITVLFAGVFALTFGILSIIFSQKPISFGFISGIVACGMSFFFLVIGIILICTGAHYLKKSGNFPKKF